MLAEVIPLYAADRQRAEPSPAEAASDTAPTSEAADTQRRDTELLWRRYGDRWPELPDAMGRKVATLERLLMRGPTAVDPSAASPSEVVVEAWLVVRAAAAHAEPMQEEAEVLGAALAADVATLHLRQLDQVVGAVLELAVVRAGHPGWASPPDAEAARLVLDAHGGDLKNAAQLHHDVYERFTDQVWDVPEARLRAGRRPWRVVARTRLRNQLAKASRTGKVPGSLTSASDLVRRARSARLLLSDLDLLLQRHLGRHHQGPMTDVDAVSASLDAVLRLQRALGERLDVERLRGLLMADAFTSPELTTPALNLRSALRDWQADVARLCGGDPWVVPASELAEWAARTGAALPEVTAALSVVATLGQAPASLRDLVDDLLLRERAGEVSATTQDIRTVADQVESGSAS